MRRKGTAARKPAMFDDDDDFVKRDVAQGANIKVIREWDRERLAKRKHTVMKVD